MTTDRNTEKPNVSFIIPMFNAEKTIEQCLTCIRNLDYPESKIQIVVVDNHSTDSSASIVKSFGIDLLLKTEGNISRVRNHGANAATGEILAFVDSDCLVQPNWLNAALPALKDETVGAVGSGYAIPGKGTWIEKSWLSEYRGPNKPTNFVPGGNLIIKKDVFLKIGGFNEALITGEDSDICNRITSHGNTILKVSGMINAHLGNSKSIRHFLKKETWYGINMMDLLLENGPSKVFILSVLFIFSEASIVFSLLYSLSFRNIYFILSFLLMISILISSAAYKASKSKKFLRLPQIFVLYFFYFNARGFAIIKRMLGLA